MKKEISTRVWASVKRTAQIIYPIMARKERLRKRIDVLTRECQICDTEMESFEQGIKNFCGGLGTKKLIRREMVTVKDKLDKDGKPIRKAVYAPSDIVSYDEKRNIYVINTDGQAMQDSVNTDDVSQPCSDYDVDASSNA